MLPEDQRHDLRKSLKTLRYVSDQFRPLWPKSDPAFLTLLADLQDDLGHLNDITVARSMGQDVPDAPQVLAHAQTLWAALQTASGGVWGGCVYDVEAIVSALSNGGVHAPDET